MDVLDNRQTVMSEQNPISAPVRGMDGSDAGTYQFDGTELADRISKHEHEAKCREHDSKLSEHLNAESAQEAEEEDEKE